MDEHTLILKGINQILMNQTFLIGEIKTLMNERDMDEDELVRIQHYNTTSYNLCEQTSGLNKIIKARINNAKKS